MGILLGGVKRRIAGLRRYVKQKIHTSYKFFDFLSLKILKSSPKVKGGKTVPLLDFPYSPCYFLNWIKRSNSKTKGGRGYG